MKTKFKAVNLFCLGTKYLGLCAVGSVTGVQPYLGIGTFW